MGKLSDALNAALGAKKEVKYAGARRLDPGRTFQPAVPPMFSPLERAGPEAVRPSRVDPEIARYEFDSPEFAQLAHGAAPMVKVPLSALKERPYADKLARYRRQEKKELPAISIARQPSGVSIIDGNHRTALARERGQETVNALDLTDAWGGQRLPSLSKNFALPALATAAATQLSPGEAEAMNIGPMAKTWSKATEAAARSMKLAGKTNKEIHAATGLFQDAGGNWGKELSDAGMRLKPGYGNLGDLIDHPSLFEAYPQLRTKTGQVQDYYSGDGNSWSPSGVRYGEKRNINLMASQPATWSERDLSGNPQSVKHATGHELQHAVDDIEGRPYGVRGDGYQPEYTNSIGEVRARNTQRRVSMTQEELDKSPPWETEDVPFYKQVLRERPILGAAAATTGWAASNGQAEAGPLKLPVKAKALPMPKVAPFPRKGPSLNDMADDWLDQSGANGRLIASEMRRKGVDIRKAGAAGKFDQPLPVRELPANKIVDTEAGLGHDKWAVDKYASELPFLRDPVQVRQGFWGDYPLIDGRHRTAGARQAGRETIDAIDATQLFPSWAPARGAALALPAYAAANAGNEADALPIKPPRGLPSWADSETQIMAREARRTAPLQDFTAPAAPRKPTTRLEALAQFRPPAQKVSPEITSGGTWNAMMNAPQPHETPLWPAATALGAAGGAGGFGLAMGEGFNNQTQMGAGFLEDARQANELTDLERRTRDLWGALPTPQIREPLGLKPGADVPRTTLSRVIDRLARGEPETGSGAAKAANFFDNEAEGVRQNMGGLLGAVGSLAPSLISGAIRDPVGFLDPTFIGIESARAAAKDPKKYGNAWALGLTGGNGAW